MARETKVQDELHQKEEEVLQKFWLHHGQKDVRTEKSDVLAEREDLLKKAVALLEICGLDAKDQVSDLVEDLLQNDTKGLADIEVRTVNIDVLRVLIKIAQKSGRIDREVSAHESLLLAMNQISRISVWRLNRAYELYRMASKHYTAQLIAIDDWTHVKPPVRNNIPLLGIQRFWCLAWRLSKTRDEKDYFGRTLLHAGLEECSQSDCTSFLEKNWIFFQAILKTGDCPRDILDAEDELQRSALHIAAREGNEFVVEQLLQHGASQDKLDIRGMTPLHYAVAFGRKRVTELLVSARNDTAMSSDSFFHYKNGLSRLQYAVKFNHDNIIDTVLYTEDEYKLRDLSYTRPALLWAVLEYHEDTVRDLMLTPTNDFDNTFHSHVYDALHAAHTNGHPSVFKLLLDCLHHRSHQGGLSYASMLIHTIKYGDITVLCSLLEHQSACAYINTSADESRRTPLWWACYYRKDDMVKLLLTYGANPHMEDAWGETPDAAAQVAGCTGIVDVFNSLSWSGNAAPRSGVGQGESEYTRP